MNWQLLLLQQQLLINMNLQSDAMAMASSEARAAGNSVYEACGPRAESPKSSSFAAYLSSPYALQLCTLALTQRQREGLESSFDDIARRWRNGSCSMALPGDVRRLLESSSDDIMEAASGTT